jgi:hypothetical protein
MTGLIDRFGSVYQMTFYQQRFLLPGVPPTRRGDRPKAWLPEYVFDAILDIKLGAGVWLNPCLIKVPGQLPTVPGLYFADRLLRHEEEVDHPEQGDSVRSIH